MLDTNIDFKFSEPENLAVYTTQQVLDGEPILYIYHDEDGDWQFHSSPEPSIGEAKIVSFSEIVKIDPTINEIYFLQNGWQAYRSIPGGEWICSKD